MTTEQTNQFAILSALTLAGIEDNLHERIIAEALEFEDLLKKAVFKYQKLQKNKALLERAEGEERTLAEAKDLILKDDLSKLGQSIYKKSAVGKGFNALNRADKYLQRVLDLNYLQKLALQLEGEKAGEYLQAIIEAAKGLQDEAIEKM